MKILAWWDGIGERQLTSLAELETLIRQYGAPDQITIDNENGSFIYR